MKKKLVSRLIKLTLCLALFALFYFLGKTYAGIPVFRALTMAFAVLSADRIVFLILSLTSPRSNRGKTLISLTESLMRYVVALVILCWGLSILGVDVSTIAASVGVVTLVVGFGAERLIEDVITGLFMLFENQYNVGDVIEVNGFRGTVNSIGIRTTTIMDSGKNLKIVNNSDMKNILNRSNNTSIAASTIDIPYSVELEALEEKLPALMEEIFKKHPDSMLSVPTYLGVQELGASAITLKFVAEVKEEDIYNASRILNRELLLGFRKLGVECPFPQLDVHTC